jgi:hypothetical protein
MQINLFFPPDKNPSTQRDLLVGLDILPMPGKWLGYFTLPIA